MIFHRRRLEPFAVAGRERRTASSLPGRNAIQGDRNARESKAQQKAAGAALAVKRGEAKKSGLKGASKGMVELMTEKELEEMASTKRKGKPEHASKD